MGHRHHIQLVTDPRAREGLSAIVAAALSQGIDSVQVRARGAMANELVADALLVGRLARSSDARVLVNDRVDVALAVRAHGVHLPARGVAPAVARGLLEAWQLVGVSVHSVEEAREAARAGADYVTFGHVYPTAGHPEPARGTAALAEVVEAVDIPVLAIGGIDARNAREALRTGCAGVALISAILDAADPAAATVALREAVDGTMTAPKAPFPERRD